MEYQETPREEPGVPRNVPGERREIREIREVRGVSREMAPAQVFLQPIASPWGLGLLALSIVNFVIGAYWARWYGAGTATVPMLLFPIILMFGGLMTLLSAMWMFRARDVLGTVALGVWGAFWLSYGLFYYLAARGVFPAALGPTYGWFFFAVAAITLSTMIAALAENWGLTLTLASLTAAAIVLGISEMVASPVLTLVAGYLFVLSALAGWYTGSALMFETSYNRTVLPVQSIVHPAGEVEDINAGLGEPGVTRHSHPGFGRPAQAGT